MAKRINAKLVLDLLAQAECLTDADVIKHLDELVERIEAHQFGDVFELPSRPGAE